MPAILRPLEIEEISLVDKGASGDPMHRPAVVFWKSEGSRMPDKEKIEAILAAMPEENRNVMIEALAAARQDQPATPEPEKQDEEEDEPKPEPEKAEPEVEKPMGEEEEEGTEKRDIQKKLNDANAKIAKLESEKALAGFVKMASEDMTHVPGLASEDLGAVLKACSENLEAKTFAKLRTTLTACSRAIEKGDLLVEIGTENGESETNLEKLDRLAKEMHEKTPDKTFHQCYRVVVKAHPELHGSEA